MLTLSKRMAERRWRSSAIEMCIEYCDQHNWIGSFAMQRMVKKRRERILFHNDFDTSKLSDTHLKAYIMVLYYHCSAAVSGKKKCFLISVFTGGQQLLHCVRKMRSLCLFWQQDGQNTTSAQYLHSPSPNICPCSDIYSRKASLRTINDTRTQTSQWGSPLPRSAEQSGSSESGEVSVFYSRFALWHKSCGMSFQ